MNEIERHKLIKAIFDQAVDIDPSEQSEFLERACAGDPLLLADVRSYLVSFENTADFIEQPAAKINDAFSSKDQYDTRFGSFEVIREVGRGGMGAVYLAKRTSGEFDQRVAIKVARQALFDGELLRRFAEERQILARLQHPNIASLIDGGVSGSGRPFFAMEYVDGVPITVFCEQADLSVRDRLRLFLKVCRAVAFAHRNLVVHRDIKPSNILIDHENEPKLLDFGLAKLSEDGGGDGARTNTIFRALTPAYASPEQLLGEQITTSSDIYSLGVVLYEMLTGLRPFETDDKNIDQIIRTVTQIEPVLPSRAGAKLSGLDRDIDNIVAYALRKEPERRYSSVEELAKDVQNYLDGRPVKARANTFRYRSQKFVMRNRAACIAASLLVLSLFIGLFVSLRQTALAFESQARATAETARSKKIAAFMEKVLNYANPSWYAEGVRTKGEAKLIEVIEDLSDKISLEFPDDIAIQAELHHKFAEIFQAKSNKERSLFHAGKALELRRIVFGEKHPEVAKDLYYLAAAKFTNANILESVQYGDEAIAMFREVDPDNQNLPYLLEDQGGVRFEHFGDNKKAEEYYTEALALFRRKDGDAGFNIARMLINLAKVYAKEGEAVKAEEYHRESQRRFMELPDDRLRNRFRSYECEFLLAKGDLAGAESLYVASRLDAGAAEDEKKIEELLRNRIGRAYRETDNYVKLAELIRPVLVAEGREPFVDPDLINHQRADLAYCLLRLGKTAEAEPLFEQAYAHFKRSAARDDRWLFEAAIAKCLALLHRSNEARPLLAHALAKYNANVPPQKEHRELTELLNQIDLALQRSS